MSNRLNISFVDENGSGGVGNLDKLPDECPQCHHRIDPNKFNGFADSQKTNDPDKESLSIIFRCTNANCQKIFIGYYTRRSGQSLYLLSRTTPVQYVPKEFPELVAKISSNFCDIYDQAQEAETKELNHISGPGYRKALEFLIKDYLISQEADEGEKEKIKKESLGECIKSKVQSENVKKMAERAAWLGNDETHYVRKWEDKDLTDLKNLIELVVHWIEMELRTQQLEQDMPVGGATENNQTENTQDEEENQN